MMVPVPVGPGPNKYGFSDMKVEIPSNAFVSISEYFIIKTFGALTNVVGKNSITWTQNVS
jgi:hypothetical protein